MNTLNKNTMKLKIQYSNTQ